MAYAEKGLGAICFPSDQGDYEPDDSTTVRIKVQQQFGMASSSKGPIVVTDKTDRERPRCAPQASFRGWQITRGAPSACAPLPS